MAKFIKCLSCVDGRVYTGEVNDEPAYTACLHCAGEGYTMEIKVVNFSHPLTAGVIEQLENRIAGMKSEKRLWWERHGETKWGREHDGSPRDAIVAKAQIVNIPVQLDWNKDVNEQITTLFNKAINAAGGIREVWGVIFPAHSLAAALMAVKFGFGTNDEPRPYNIVWLKNDGTVPPRWILGGIIQL